VRDDEGRLGATGDDHVAQVAVVLLDVALACAYCQALFLLLDIPSPSWFDIILFRDG
jgi:hypothetical protein